MWASEIYLICAHAGRFIHSARISYQKLVQADDGSLMLEAEKKDKKGRFKNPKVKDAIEWIDKTHGLDTPVIVIGYGVLNRCVSVRSNYRVITHAIINALDGVHMGNMHQMCMRAAGLTRELRKSNGFNAVKLLCREHDYQILQTLYHFTTAVLKEAGDGEQESLNTWKFVDYNDDFAMILDSWRAIGPKGIAKHWPLNARPRSVPVASYIFEGNFKPDAVLARDGISAMPFDCPPADILQSFGIPLNVVSDIIEATGFKVFEEGHKIFKDVSSVCTHQDPFVSE